MNFLSKVILTKKHELRQLKQERPLKRIKKEVSLSMGKKEIRPFEKIFQKSLAIIAEIKLKSPSEGTLTTHNYKKLARIYKKSGVEAISVLTDKKFFNGNIKFLKLVKRIVPQPILRKDFIIDEYQVYETYLAGADAFLLMAKILTLKQLKHLMNVAESLKLQYIVEIHDERDLHKALKSGAKIIGINNRDLSDLKVDITRTGRLIRLIPKNRIVISESGLKDSGDVKYMKNLGVKGILVGTSITKSKNPFKKLKELQSV